MIDGDHIKKVRAALGESQAQFAKRFGVNQSTVDRWESAGVTDRGVTEIAVRQVLASIERDEAAA